MAFIDLHITTLDVVRHDRRNTPMNTLEKKDGSQSATGTTQYTNTANALGDASGIDESQPTLRRRSRGRPPRFNVATVTHLDFNQPLVVKIEKHEIQRSFEHLAALGRTFLLSVIRALEEYLPALAKTTCITQIRSINLFFEFCILARERGGPYESFVQACASGRMPSADDLDIALTAFRSELERKHGLISASPGSTLSPLMSALRALARASVIPSFVPIYIQKTKPSVPRMTLLQALGSTAPEPTDSLPDFEPDIDLFGVEVRGLAALGMTIPKVRSEISEAIYRGEENIISRIRRGAEAIVSDWLRRKDFIRNLDTHVEESETRKIEKFMDTFRSDKDMRKTSEYRRELSDDLFVGLGEFGFRLLIGILDYMYISRMGGNPLITMEDVQVVRRSNQYMNGVVRRHFSMDIRERLGAGSPRELLAETLVPSCRVQAAVAIMLMCDTGMNRQPVLDLPSTPLGETDDPKLKSIAGWKMRAGGKLVTSELRVKDDNTVSSVRAYNEILDSTGRIARLFTANPALHGRAFLAVEGLLCSGSSITVLPLRSTTFESTFREIVRSDEVLRKSPICSGQIRTSVLTVYRKRTGSIGSTQRAADHSSVDTTQRYTDRPLFHLSHDETIRRFQILLQALILDSVAEAETNELVMDALREGLGVLLPETAKAHDSAIPSAWMPAIQASEHPLRVVITSRLLADMMDFNRYLQDNSDEILSARPERWLQDWLPWKILTDEVIRRTRVGRFARIHREAVEINRHLGARSWPPL